MDLTGAGVVLILGLGVPSSRTQIIIPHTNINQKSKRSNHQNIKDTGFTVTELMFTLVTTDSLFAYLHMDSRNELRSHGNDHYSPSSDI